MKRTIFIVGLGLLGIAAVCAGVACGQDGEEETGGRQCSPETCDGFDNNCDGNVDEGCPCNDGKEQSCYSDTPQTANIGECHTGVQQCVGGKWGNCSGQILPSIEVCDGLDNNCDGAVDNDCTPYSQSQFAQTEESIELDRHEMPLGVGENLHVDFSWNQENGPTPAFDLTVSFRGMNRALAQVFSVRGRPFVRIGTRAEGLEPGVTYRIEVSRTQATIQLNILRATDGTLVLAGPETPISQGDQLVLAVPHEDPQVHFLH